MGLSVREISVEIDGAIILDRVSLDVPTATTIAVVGPSGAGKSTLLRVIAGIIRPNTGSVTIDGIDVTSLPAHRRRVGMVFQDDQLFPHLDVAANIAFGLDVQRPLIARLRSSPKMRRRTQALRASRVEEMLTLVGLTGFGGRRTSTLSGGEAKRVALARALAASPSVLLLDEPLTGLDRELHDRLMHDLRRILGATKTTAILVTHDPQEASFLADMSVRLDRPAPTEPTVAG